MNTALTPYRSQAILGSLAKKPTSGWLRHPNQPIPHKCKLPGFWYSVWRWMIRNPIQGGDLYRCEQCGIVRKVWGKGTQILIGGGFDWWSDDIKSQKFLAQEWAEAGGDIKEE